MGQHDAAFNPLTFTVWFEYAAGMNNRLNQAIDQLLQNQTRLSDEDFWRLYQTYVADIDPQAMHRIGSELQRVMQTMAEAAVRTGDHAGEFSAQLESLVSELQGVNEKLMTPAVTLALDGTTRMRSSAQALESEVKNNQLEIKRLQTELTRVRDESMQDALTHVLNRKGFDVKLAEMLVRPVEPGRAHGLVMLDIDHFKKVNDSRGHACGDAALHGLAVVLEHHVRRTDLLGRLGGEEFVAFLPDTPPLQAFQLAERLRVQVAAAAMPVPGEHEPVRITISIGLAMLHEGESLDALLARADEALYQAKHQGRNRVVSAEPLGELPALTLNPET